MSAADSTSTIAAHLNGARDEVIDALVKLAPTLDTSLEAVRALLFALADLDAVGRELDEVSFPPPLDERISRSGGRVVSFPGGDTEVPQ